MTAKLLDAFARAARRRGAWIERLIVLAAIAAGATAVLLQDQRLWRLDALVADGFQRAAPRAYDPTIPVRIVAIDSESLRRFGQWPWPRPYFADLTERLNRLGAAAIAYDVLFAEPDRTSPEATAASRARLGADPGADLGAAAELLAHTRYDAEFAAAIARAPVALAATPNPAGRGAGPLQRKFGLALAGSDPRARVRALAAVDEPLPILVANARGYGLGGVDISGGRVVRRLPIFQVVGGALTPSLAMEALRLAQQANAYALRSSDASGEAGGGAAPALVDVRNGAIVFPVAADGTAWVRFAGAQAARFVPAWRILESDPSDPLLRAAIEGQIVFVAPTAPGLGQPVETPLGAALPVVLQAELLEQALMGVTLERPDWAGPAEALALVALALATALATARRSALTGAAVAVLAAGAAVAGAWFAFDRAGLVLAPLTPAAVVLFVFLALTVMNYARTRRETGAVRSQFERFVAPAVIRELVENPERRLSMKGEQRDLSVLFGDARGFTTLSETLPPDELISYLNACFSELTAGVLAHGGTVDKYMGDCIMAFWNAPLPDPDHADKAVRAIFAMRAAVLRLSEAFLARGLPPVDFGFGLNTGPCHVGLMGSETRLEYSCVGDVVNVASRLQDLTKVYGVWNIVTAEAADAAPDWIAAPLGQTAIRGRTLPATICTLLGPAGEPLSEAHEALRQTLVDAATADAAGRAAALDALRGLRAPGIDGARLADALRRHSA